MSDDLLVVYGATGGTGREVVKQALASGTRVRAFVRDASKVPTEWSLDEKFSSFVGDLSDTDAVTRALDGATYAICVAGSQPLWAEGGMAKMVQAVVEAMPSCGLKRFLFQAGAFSPIPGEKQPVMIKLMKAVFGTLMKLKDAINDNTAALEVLCATSNVDWCATRPGKIVDGESRGKLKEGTKAGATITYVDLAAFELEMIHTDAYNGKAVYPVYD